MTLALLISDVILVGSTKPIANTQNSKVIVESHVMEILQMGMDMGVGQEMKMEMGMEMEMSPQRTCSCGLVMKGR